MVGTRANIKKPGVTFAGDKDVDVGDRFGFGLVAYQRKEIGVGGPDLTAAA